MLKIFSILNKIIYDYFLATFGESLKGTLRVFALILAKFFVYFSRRIYFFYFTYSLFGTSYIRLSIFIYFS